MPRCVWCTPFQAHFRAAQVTLMKLVCFTSRSSYICVRHQSAVWGGRSLKAAVYLKMLSVTDSQGTRGSPKCRGCVEVTGVYVSRPDRLYDHVLSCDLWPLPHRCPPCRPANSCPMCWSDPESLMLSCLHPSPYNTPLLCTPTGTRKSLWGTFNIALVLFRHCLSNADVRLYAAVQAKSKLGQEVEGFNDLEIRCAVSQ